MNLEIYRHSKKNPLTYKNLDQKQQAVFAQIKKGLEGRFFLAEVSPVITFGKQSHPTDLLMAEEEYHKRGIELLPTDRGGLATYHGPGQWIFFPVEKLEKLVGDPRGVRKITHRLLLLALNVCQNYEPSSHLRTGAETGVWDSYGKLASVGIRIQDGILLHGLAINVFKDSTSFYGIHPCGLKVQPSFLFKYAPYDETLFLEVRDQLIGEIDSFFLN